MKALVIDDDVIMRLTLRGMLAGTAVSETIFATDGSEGLKILETVRPDIILLDLGMPQMNGMETLQRIRKDPALRRIPVVVVTASAEEEAIGELMAMGISDYLLKPLDPIVAAARVDRILRYQLTQNQLTE
ncbi:MAG: PleD family two-component system response regulator [Gemmatimonadota bacterium]